MVQVSPQTMQTIAEKLIIGKEPLKETIETTGLPQPIVSMLKNSHLAHIRAVDIILKDEEYLLSRINRKQIEVAAILHVKNYLTADEIDQSLNLKPGTFRLLTRHKVWEFEKYRVTRFGERILEETDGIK